MKQSDIFKLSLNSLTHRGLRSWLTILGIIIGVAAVVAMLSIGSGMTQTVEAELSGFGADILYINPGYAEAEGKRGFFGGKGEEIEDEENPKLTDSDIHTISNVEGIIAVNGFISGFSEVQYLSESISLSINGINPIGWNEISTLELESGRYLNPGDSNSVLIGNSVANNIFDQTLTINTQIKIDDKTFIIVGILSESGTGGFGEDDKTVYMIHDAARDIIENINSNEYSYIEAKIIDTDLVDEIIENVENSLYKIRMVTEDTQDFTVTSPTSFIETITSTVQTLSFFFIGIAAISLLVGAIGIANTMFMSVLERTRLIGIFKSLGARNSEIMKLFLTESGIIGFMGGLLGVFLGLIIIGFISNMSVGFMEMKSMGNNASIVVVTPELILFSLAFATTIGIISGLIPARQAAKLQVVEAMRSE